ncbi:MULTISPECIES: hypothetical protein [Paenibacillus]|uniref:Membrane protein YqhR n=1 Tax=Paenibacillus pabuli TaxID=1472 RepID=A0A855Y4T5_9BACL|nr:MULTISPECIES: hypothetical protein [Paenibacillus]PWW45352.1 hypothetical protein DET56_101560 [Paenibacillus pabuli]PXW11689.1 hypothetical protein DEU73_101559 [Paenibacillus taichungensis]
MPEHLAKSTKSLKHIFPWKAGVLTGLTSGLVLGFFLKAIQTYTGEKVYTLLLNIDFVPWLPPKLPEYIEFVLHLIVSIIIGIFYIWWIQRSGHPISKGILIGVLSSLLYIPLSQLSSRVPDLYDIKAILYWLVGHLLFGVVVGVCGHVWKHSQKGDPPFRHE